MKHMSSTTSSCGSSGCPIAPLSWSRMNKIGGDGFDNNNHSSDGDLVPAVDEPLPSTMPMQVPQSSSRMETGTGTGTVQMSLPSEAFASVNDNDKNDDDHLDVIDIHDDDDEEDEEDDKDKNEAVVLHSPRIDMRKVNPDMMFKTAPLPLKKKSVGGGVPGPFVGSAWGAPPGQWPGVDGISHNRNFLSSYADVITNDPQQQMSMNDAGYTTLRSSVGGAGRGNRANRASSASRASRASRANRANRAFVSIPVYRGPSRRRRRTRRRTRRTKRRSTRTRRRHSKKRQSKKRCVVRYKRRRNGSSQRRRSSRQRQGQRQRQSRRNGGGLLPQDLAGLGEKVSYNVSSTYNALLGRPAPVNPAPFKDQLVASV